MYSVVSDHQTVQLTIVAGVALIWVPLILLLH